MCMTSTGTNSSVSEFKPPSMTMGELGPGTSWQEFLQRGGEIASKYGTDPNLIYGNNGQPMVAQMSDLQNRAANTLNGLSSQGNPNDSLANGYLADVMSGKQQNIQPNNPYLGAESSYGGSSPQFEAMLKASNQDITDAFSRGTAAQTDAAAAKSGAFGGSAYNEMVQSNNANLAKQVQNNSNSMRNDQYNRAAQLEQGDLSRNSGLAQQGIQNAWQGFENNAARGLQAVGANQAQGGMDLQRALSLMGAGDLQRQIQSENIGAAQDLFNQNVQQPLQALDIYRSILQAASGQGGQSTATQFGGGQSGIANGLGGMAALYGLLGK